MLPGFLAFVAGLTVILFIDTRSIRRGDWFSKIWYQKRQEQEFNFQL